MRAVFTNKTLTNTNIEHDSDPRTNYSKTQSALLRKESETKTRKRNGTVSDEDISKDPYVYMLKL